MSATLSDVESIIVSTVLQDCADQLAVLGHIIPATHRSRQSAAMVLSDKTRKVTEQQKGAEQNLKPADQDQGAAGELSDAIRELHICQKKLNCTSDVNTHATKLAKVKQYRQSVAQMINEVLVEVKEKGTYNCLILSVEQEKRKKADQLDIVIREKESCQRVKALQRQLLDIRKEKSLELQKRKDRTAFLKNKLQERKLKTEMERKYVKSSTELQVYQGQKFNSHCEKELEDEIKLLHKRLEQEKKLHLKTMTFLKERYTSLEETLEGWSQRYDRDMDDKEEEIDIMKIKRANNISKHQELANEIKAMKLVIIEDRMEKETKRRQQDKVEQDAATKIQSWWRMILVCRGLGPTKKGKKPNKKGKKPKGNKTGKKKN